MLKVTDTIESFDDLQNRCWGQAISVLDEIYNAGKEDELLDHLEDVFFTAEPTITDINDYLAYEWEEIYKEIGLKEDGSFDYDDDMLISKIHANIDQLREMGHEINEPNDADLEYIFKEIDAETYTDEEELDDYIYALILTYLEEDDDD